MRTKTYTSLVAFCEHISLTGQVPVINRNALRREFELLGAPYSDIDEKSRKKLKMYTNLSRANTMREVWYLRFEIYKKWTNDWIAEYEALTGITLAKLDDSGRKNSGLIHFFCELTALAFLSPEEYSYAEFRKRIQTKLYNGFQWAQGKRKLKHREKLSYKGIDEGKPFAPASIPLSFPRDAAKFITGGFNPFKMEDYTTGSDSEISTGDNE